jgi:signal transduction histidine kinase
MLDGGTIAISASAEIVTKQDHLAKLATGRYVRLVVDDEGCGMDENTINRAMEPFFTAKERGKGTGLGLSMAYGFAERSRGALKIESQPARHNGKAIASGRGSRSGDGTIEAQQNLFEIFSCLAGRR